MRKAKGRNLRKGALAQNMREYASSEEPGHELAEIPDGSIDFFAGL
jgi:hypothetical protein